jgi:DNA-binding response OmpR family regulator
VAILADDLIWATRLANLVRAADAVAVPVRSAATLQAVLPDVDRVIVDLTARAYDGVDGVARAHAAGKPVLAVGQHDDIDLRRRALAAGADRVHPYRQLFEDGPRQLGRWLAAGAGGTTPDAVGSPAAESLP